MTRPFAILFCAAALMTGSVSQAADAPRRAPGFALPDFKGGIHDLADYRGKVVILEFMQSTCPHCATFNEKLSALAAKYGDRVAILAVGNPPVDSPATLSKYAAGHRISYPVLLDCGQMTYSYVRSTRVDLPMVFLIDAGGTIRSQHAWGPLERDIFEGNGLSAEVDRLLPAGGAAKKGK